MRSVSSRMKWRFLRCYASGRTVLPEVIIMTRRTLLLSCLCACGLLLAGCAGSPPKAAPVSSVAAPAATAVAPMAAAMPVTAADAGTPIPDLDEDDDSLSDVQ